MKVNISGIRSFSIWILVTLWVTACASPEVITVPSVHEPPPPKTTLTPPAPVPAETALKTIPYTIQVGAFSTTVRAARYSVGLQNHGVDAYYFIDEDGLYKVRIERFEFKEKAHKRALELQALGRIDEFYIIQPVSPVRLINPHTSLRKSIVQTALRFIGTPYRWGGASTAKGFDCSGLTMTVYRLNGLELPRSSRSQFKKGERIRRDDLQKGDLVFFATNGRGRVSHVGIYTGEGKFVHAPGRGKRIRISFLAKKYFKSRYMGARRYF